MLRLAVHTLRFRPGGFVASFIALSLGTAIVMACGGLMETGLRLAVPPQRLAAAPLVVTGDLSYPERVRLDADVAATIRELPGVADAIVDVSFPATVLRHHWPVTGDTDLHGHGWASAALGSWSLTEGSEPSAADEVVLDAALAERAGVEIGEPVEIAVRGAAQRFTVAGIAAARMDRPYAVFFSDEATRAHLAAGDTIDSVAVVTTPAADTADVAQQIDQALRGQGITTLRGDDRGLAEFPSASSAGETLVVLSAVFGGLAILVAVFVVASTVGLSIQLRQRENALLRAIGTTPGQLRRMLVSETLLVWVLASSVAFLPGRRLGAWLVGQMTAKGVVPDVIAFHQGWIPTAGATGISLLVALTATLIAVRAAAVARPAEALTEASLQRRWLSVPRLVFAVVCLGGGLALGIVTATVLSGPVAASTAGPSAMLWAAGLALLGPGIAAGMAVVLRPLLRTLTGTAGRLATVNVRVRSIRMAGVITPVMLVTGLATALIYLQTAQASVERRAYAETLRADAVLTSSVGGLPMDLVADIGRRPEVADASAVITSTGYLPTADEDPQDAEVSLVGVTPDDGLQTMAVPLRAGTLSDLRGDTVALSSQHAADLDASVGDTIVMRLGDRTDVTLTIVAVFSARPGFETALVPGSLLRRHTTTGLASQILVRAAPGTDTGELAAGLRELSQRQPGLEIANRIVAVDAHAQAERTGAWVNYLLVAVIVGYATLSLINTLIIAAGERRRDLAVQRLLGATRRQVQLMMSVEALFVAVSGILLGGIVAAATLVPFSVALTGTAAPVGPVWIYLAVVASSTVLTIAATLLPTWFTLRTRPMHVLAASA